ncbi:MAG: TonB-dependent receptor, partial [Pedobacter sp.]
AGMGIFALTPQAAEEYTAIVTLDDNSTKSFKLPQVLESGYTLAVNQIEENLSVKISSTTDLVNGKEVYVIAQANGVVYASFSTKLDKAILTANIAKKNFPTGIVQISLFSADGKPIAERLVFVNHKDFLKISGTNTFEPIVRKKANLDIKVTDINGNPIDGNFSVSVTDAGKTPFDEDEEKTILSNLLLTSDLKGYIEKPNYYFNEANPDKEKHLDYLSLTQGWTRFVWADILADKEPDITFRPEQSLEIAGKITTLGDKPLPNAKVLMFSSTPGYTFMLDTISDAKGNFVFDRLEIPDTVSFIIQSKSNKDNRNINLVLNKAPKVPEHKYLGNDLDIVNYLSDTKLMYNELDKFNMLDKGIKLNTVNITGQRRLKALVNVPNSANGSGAADQVVNSEKLEYETSMLTAFSKIPGVYVKNDMVMRASSRTVSLTQAPQPMLVILDGVYVKQAQNPTFITSINPRDVEGIEVLTSNYNTSIFGDDGFWGVIFITTKNGSTLKNTPSTNTNSTKNRGFTAVKQFYSPNYDDPKTNQKLQDLRSTIYWNPNVATNEKGQANLNFFNANTRGIYKVTVEGMDSFGTIGRNVYTYEVK